MIHRQCDTHSVFPGKFNQYRSYKHSGIEWLGHIPANWDLKRLSRITYCLDSRRIPLNSEQRAEKQGQYPYWGANSIVDYVDEWLFDEELVLIGEDGAPFFDKNKTVAFRVTGKIWVNNHAHVLRPDKGQIDAKFLSNALNCVDYRSFIDGSTRDKLTQSDLNAIPIQCPPLPEQRAIAAFLDRETARIDTLVAKKERLIELLQEKRSALISRAVTRGLDPDVPTKDSGIEWLGEIPVHWEVQRLKHAANKIGSGKTPRGGAERYISEGIMLLRSQNIHFRGLELADVAYIDAVTDDEMSGSRVREGDVLLNITGASLGRCCVALLRSLRANVNQHVCIIRPNRIRTDSSFLARVIESHSLQDQIFNYENGVSRDALNFEQAGTLVIAAPSLFEQRAIADFLDSETRMIDALAAKVREAIERLKELRSASISAAVTGKIDLRNEFAEAPAAGSQDVA